MPLKTVGPAIHRRLSRTPWAASILVLAAWAVYYPALNRVFVTDQIWYFAELDGRTSLLDGVRYYDYAATRRYWKGDDALFRPLLFVWLAVGNSLFRYHHVRWNVANLVLHGLVALFLFRLLLSVAASGFALLAALLFTVMKPPLELVVWHHLGGYLLACVFLLIGLRAFVRLTADRGPATSHRETALYAIALTLAGLFHESMVAVAVLGAVILGVMEWRRRRRPAAGHLVLLASPVLVFSLLYAFHVQRVGRFSYVDRLDGSSLFEARNVITLVPRTFDAVARWSMEVLLPSALTFTPEPFARLGKSFAPSLQDPLQLLNAAVALALLIGAAASISRRHLARVAPFLMVLAGAAFAYTAIICLGRSQPEVLGVTYYLYPFCLLATVLGYSAIDVERVTGWRRRIAAGALVMFILFHAIGTGETTRKIGEASRNASRYLSTVARFVDTLKTEPDFSFAIQGDRPYVDPEVLLREGYPDDPASPAHVRRLTEIVFSRYYDRERPKYVLP